MTVSRERIPTCWEAEQCDRLTVENEKLRRVNRRLYEQLLDTVQTLVAFNRKEGLDG